MICSVREPVRGNQENLWWSWVVRGGTKNEGNRKALLQFRVKLQKMILRIPSIRVEFADTFCKFYTITSKRFLLRCLSTVYLLLNQAPPDKPVVFPAHRGR